MKENETVKKELPSVREAQKTLVSKGMKRKTFLITLTSAIKLEIHAAKKQVTESHLVSALIEKYL